MLIYIITFAISSLFAYFAQKTKKSKILIILFSIMSVAIPSLIAGMRDLTIGTDLQVYGENYFNRAVESSSFSEYSKICNTDLGYRIINYTVSLFSNDIHVFLFVLEFITIGIVYIALYQRKNQIPLWLGMLCYLFLFFNRNLNILRQGVAISIVIYSFKYIERRQLKQFIISTIIASFCHVTAIFAIPIYIIRIAIEGRKRMITIPLIIIATLVVILTFGKILTFLNNMGILAERYERYIPEGGFNIYILETFMYMLYPICGMIFYKGMKKVDKNYLFYIIIAILVPIFTQARGFTDYADRIAFYYMPAFIIMLPKIPQIVGKRKVDKMFMTEVIILIFFVFWYYKYIITGSCETYPYTSQILNIR